MVAALVVVLAGCSNGDSEPVVSSSSGSAAAAKTSAAATTSTLFDQVETAIETRKEPDGPAARGFGPDDGFYVTWIVETRNPDDKFAADLTATLQQYDLGGKAGEPRQVERATVAVTGEGEHTFKFDPTGKAGSWTVTVEGDRTDGGPGFATLSTTFTIGDASEITTTAAATTTSLYAPLEFDIDLRTDPKVDHKGTEFTRADTVYAVYVVETHLPSPDIPIVISVNWRRGGEEPIIKSDSASVTANGTSEFVYDIGPNLEPGKYHVDIEAKIETSGATYGRGTSFTIE